MYELISFILTNNSTILDILTFKNPFTKSQTCQIVIRRHLVLNLQIYLLYRRVSVRVIFLCRHSQFEYLEIQGFYINACIKRYHNSIYKSCKIRLTPCQFNKNHLKVKQYIHSVVSYYSLAQSSSECWTVFTQVQL